LFLLGAKRGHPVGAFSSDDEDGSPSPGGAAAGSFRRVGHSAFSFFLFFLPRISFSLLFFDIRQRNPSSAAGTVSAAFNAPGSFERKQPPVVSSLSPVPDAATPPSSYTPDKQPVAAHPYIITDSRSRRFPTFISSAVLSLSAGSSVFDAMPSGCRETISFTVKRLGFPSLHWCLVGHPPPLFFLKSRRSCQTCILGMVNTLPSSVSTPP